MYNRVLEPFYCLNDDIKPWSHYLYGKKVLIVNPFVDSFQKQIQNNFKMFKDDNKYIFHKDLQFVYYKSYVTSAGNHLHSDSLKLLTKYMMANKDEYLILDGDMFLIDTLNIGKYREKMCACVLQERPNTKYIWPNLFYININNLNINKDDFNLCIDGGDTGSASSKWLKKYNYLYPNCKDIRYSNNQYENDKFYFIKHLWSGSWNIEELPENLKTNNSLIEFLKNDKRNKDEKYFSEIYDKCIFHYRGSTWLNINDEILHKENINKLKDLI